MTISRRFAGRRATLAAVALALVAGAAGCGEDTSEGDERAALGALPNPDRPIDDPALQTAGDKARIQEVVDDVQDALLMLSGWGVCSELSSANPAKRGDDCVATYDRLLRSPRMAKMRRVRSTVESIDVGPNQAIAVVATPGRPTFRLRLRRESAAWKLPRVDLDDPTGLPIGQP